MSSKDKDRDKDRDKKHRKSASSSSSSSGKSSSSSDSKKKKKSSSHKSSSSRATHNTRRDTPNDEYDEENDDLQSIEEDGQEYTEPSYDGNSNVVGAAQGYYPPVGYTHSRPVRPDLSSRLEPPVNYTVPPGMLSQIQSTYTTSVNYGQSTSTQQASSRALGVGESYPASSPYYPQSGVLPQAQRASHNPQINPAPTTSTQHPSGRPEAAGNRYSSVAYSTQQNPAETSSEFPATSDLATAIEEVAAYTHAPRNSPPTGPASMPRTESRTQPWQDPSMEQNLHHGPLEPWNENPTEEGTLYDDTNRVKREDDITGS